MLQKSLQAVENVCAGIPEENQSQAAERRDGACSLFPMYSIAVHILDVWVGVDFFGT